MNGNEETLKYVLFIVVLGYFSADSALILIRHGWPFGTVQWMLLLITIACAALFFILLIRLYKTASKVKELSERKEEDETEKESKI